MQFKLRPLDVTFCLSKNTKIKTKTHSPPLTCHLLQFQVVGGARPTLSSWWTSRPASAPTTLSKSKTSCSAWPRTSRPSAPRPLRLVEVPATAVTNTVTVKSHSCTDCPPSPQLAVVHYSDEPRIEFRLNEFSDRNSVLRALRSLRYVGGNTRTGQ